MPTGPGASPEVVKTSLDEVLFAEYDAPVAAGTAHADTADMFKISPVNNAAAIEEEFAGPGKWITREELGDVEEDEILTGNKTTHAVLEWDKDLPVPKIFYDKLVVALTIMLKKIGLNGGTPFWENPVASICLNGI
jgi:hypothetical protein